MDINIENQLNEIDRKLNILLMQKPPKRSLASVFIQEYINNEDLNDDELVYGYDFIIKEDDDIPSILLEFQIKFNNKDKLSQKNWKDILYEYR